MRASTGVPTSGASIDSVELDTSGWRSEESSAERAVWERAGGDQLRLVFFARPDPSVALELGVDPNPGWLKRLFGRGGPA